jgi:hypothetical protein
MPLGETAGAMPFMVATVRIPSGRPTIPIPATSTGRLDGCTAITTSTSTVNRKDTEMTTKKIVEQIEAAGKRMAYSYQKISGKIRVDTPLDFQVWKSTEIFHLIDGPDSECERHYVVTFTHGSRVWSVKEFPAQPLAISEFVSAIQLAQSTSL